METDRPTVLMNTAATGENNIPLARYKIESGRTIVKLFNPNNRISIITASATFFGVYFTIVSTDNGSPDIFTIKTSITAIARIAITGINFFHLSL